MVDEKGSLMLAPACETMKSYSPPWWIAGGWAIDLYLNRQT